MGVLIRKRDGAWWVFINHRGQPTLKPPCRDGRPSAG